MEAALEKKLSCLLDPRIGVLRWLFEATLQPDEPPIHIAFCEFTNPLKIRPQRISDKQWQDGSLEAGRLARDLSAGGVTPDGVQQATGAAGDRISALWATVGEACERYAMHTDPGRTASSAREGELSGPVVSPARFILFSPEQYESGALGYDRYDPAKPLFWRAALNLSNGEQCHVPAQFVSGPLAKRDHQLLDNLYSTGCAAGSSPAHAVNTGLREVIERDAFMFYWLSRTTPKRIVLESVAPHLPEWLRPMLDWQGVELHALWFDTGHGIPVVCAMLLRRTGEGVAVGACCHLDWRVALEKAVVEAFHTLNWVIDMDRWDVAPAERDEVRDFADHVAYYRKPGTRTQIEFLLNGPEIELDPADDLPDPEDYRAHTRQMVHRLAPFDLEVYAVNLTPADIASIDLHVARVLVPGMHPLHAGIGSEHLDRRRLETIASAIGVDLASQLNLDPHPFP